MLIFFSGNLAGYHILSSRLYLSRQDMHSIVVSICAVLICVQSKYSISKNWDFCAKFWFSVFQGAPGDIVQLHRALTARISVSKRSNIGTQNANSQKAAERLEAAADEEDYLEKADDDEQDDAADDIALDEDVPDDELANNDRLESDQEQKTEEHESNVDGMKVEKDSKALKRKEPANDETSPKRQCPEILIE